MVVEVAVEVEAAGVVEDAGAEVIACNWIDLLKGSASLLPVFHFCEGALLL